MTAERDFLVGVALVRGEGVVALLPAPEWQHFGRSHTIAIETKYAVKTEVKIMFSVFVQVCSLAVYVF